MNSKNNTNEGLLGYFSNRSCQHNGTYENLPLQQQHHQYQQQQN